MDRQSNRADMLGKILAARGWSVKLCCCQKLQSRNYANEQLHQAKLRNAIKFCSKWPNAPIHVFTNAISLFAAGVILRFRERAIFDPIDVICGNQKSLAEYILRSGKLHSGVLKLMIRNILTMIPLQRLAFLISKNVVFRDLQIISAQVMSPSRRRKRLNSILFADYFNEQVAQHHFERETQLPQRRPCFVSCGNIHTLDHKSGEAYIHFSEDVLSKGCSVVFYPVMLGHKSINDYLDANPLFKSLSLRYSNLQIREPLPHHELGKVLRSYDGGMFLIGEHYFNTDTVSNGIWRSELFMKNCGNRATAYMESGLIVLTGLMPRKSYYSFILRRYGNVMPVSENTPFDLERFQLVSKNARWRVSQKFQLSSNIARLEMFYNLVRGKSTGHGDQNYTLKM